MFCNSVSIVTHTDMPVMCNHGRDDGGLISLSVIKDNKNECADAHPYNKRSHGAISNTLSYNFFAVRLVHSMAIFRSSIASANS